MIKMKRYIQPSMVMVNLQHQHIICRSQVQHGVNTTLQIEEEVDDSWVKESHTNLWDEVW